MGEEKFIKKQLVIIGIADLPLCVGLSGCSEFFSEGGTIYVEKMNKKPENFINISEQQMDQFLHTKQAINQTDSIVEPPTDEWNDLRDFLGICMLIYDIKVSIITFVCLE